MVENDEKIIQFPHSIFRINSKWPIGTLKYQTNLCFLKLAKLRKLKSRRHNNGMYSFIAGMASFTLILKQLRPRNVKIQDDNLENKY